MTATQPDEESALGRAEVIAKRLEEEAERLARSTLARAVELAEDIWAEAQGERRKQRAKR